MKRLICFAVVCFSLGGPIYSQNATSTPSPCAACGVKAPEPGLLMQLGLGLPALGGLLILARGRYLNRHHKQS